MTEFPSRRVKESIKTALAMTLAYGLALWFDWDKPMWAGFAVAAVSLSNVGLSVTKAFNRACGTLVAVITALTIIALFAQERWLFMIALTCYAGICAYFMGRSRRPYFWQVSAWVTAVICFDAGPTVDPFNLAILRAEETALGIAAYSLVALLLWPLRSSSGFSASIRTLAETQQKLFDHYLELMQGRGNPQESATLKGQMIQQQTQSAQLLDTALIDTYEIKAHRRQWRANQDMARSLGETIEHWHAGFAEIQALDPVKALPGFPACVADVRARFSRLVQLHDGNPSPPFPAPQTKLEPSADGMAVLSNFQRAAVLAFAGKLTEISNRLQSMEENLRAIYGRKTATGHTPPTRRFSFIFDPDCGLAAFRLMLAMWMAYLIVMFVDNVPGGNGLIIISLSVGLAAALMPQVRLILILPPIAISLFVSGVFYLVIMPHLSSYMQLGSLMFVVVFVICYLFYEPKMMIGRVAGLFVFTTIISPTNHHQGYYLQAVTSIGLVFFLCVFLLIVVANIPFGTRPERNILFLLRRYFRSCEYLLSTLESMDTPRVSWMQRQRRAFHTQEVSGIPRKLAMWIGALDDKALGASTKEHAGELLASLQEFSFRILSAPAGRPKLLEETHRLNADFHQWQIKLRETLIQLSKDPGAANSQTFRNGLANIMETLEQQITAHFTASEIRSANTEESENFYHMLEAYRSLSTSLVQFAGTAEKIDWNPWKEERFY